MEHTSNFSRNGYNLTMHTPDYQEYSLAQLEDCLYHLNRERYPERLKLIEQEIALRKERGEKAIDLTVNELTGRDIPYFFAMKVWWFYTWRLLTGCALAGVLFTGIARINSILEVLSPEQLLIASLVTAVFLLLFTGPTLMMQALAKRYIDYRIIVIRREFPCQQGSNPKLPPRSAT